MSGTALSLNDLAQISYTVSPLTQSITSFNLGLIIGTSTVISTSTRVASYSSLAAMVTAGFSNTSPEYLAAQMYFSGGSPGSAPTQVLIGRQATGETCLTALTACRAANTSWYGVFIPGAGNSDHTACAAYVQTLTSPYCMYLMQTNSATVLSNSTGNIFASLNGSMYTRTLGMYSSTSYTVAGLLGYMMGNTSVAAGSAYTLSMKSITGSTTDALTESQVTNLKTNNGNFYANYGGFSTYQTGTNFGQWTDVIINLDLFVTKVQQDVVALLTSVNKIPQTEAGMAQIKTTIANDCDLFVRQGTFAPGTWTGATFGQVTTGQNLAAGYLIWSDPIATQSASNRSQRIAPNIYIACKLAGAVQSVIIQVSVNS
jgi:hypothetical protein